MTAPNVPTPLRISFSPPPGRSVLVVDDEPIIRRIAQLSLTGAGYAVSEAGDTATATSAIQSAAAPFDLVLLDLTLPDGDGATVIPAIRKHAPAARILVVSGLGELDPASVGADAFLAKPFTKSSLLIAVQFVLTKAQSTPMAPPDAV